MAKNKKNASLRDSLHARGLRNSVADTIAGLGAGRGRKQPPKAARRVIENLKAMAGEIEDRTTGGPAKRKAAARKGALTRKRNADQRSASARKAARTRKKTTA